MTKREMNRKKNISRVQAFMVDVGMINEGVCVESIAWCENEDMPGKKSVLIVTDEIIKY